MEEINLTKHRNTAIKKSRGGEFPAGNSDFEPTSEGMELIVTKHLIELVRDYKAANKELDEIKAILPDIHILDEDKSDFNSIDHIIEAMDGKWNDKKRHYFIVRQKAKTEDDVGHRYTIIVENSNIYIVDMFFGAREKHHEDFIKELKKSLSSKDELNKLNSMGTNELGRKATEIFERRSKCIKEELMELLKKQKNDTNIQNHIKELKGELININTDKNIIEKSLSKKRLKSNQKMFNNEELKEIILRSSETNKKVIEVGFCASQGGGLQRGSGACEGFSYIPIFLIERALNFNRDDGSQSVGFQKFVTVNSAGNVIFDFTNKFGKVLKNLDENPLSKTEINDKQARDCGELKYSENTRFNEEFLTTLTFTYNHGGQVLSNKYVLATTKKDCKTLKQSMGGFKVTKEKYKQALAELESTLKKELQPAQPVAIVPYVDPFREFRPTRLTFISGLLETMKKRETERILKEAEISRTIIKKSHLESVKRSPITEDNNSRIVPERRIVKKFSKHVIMRNSEKVASTYKQNQFLKALNNLSLYGPIEPCSNHR